MFSNGHPITFFIAVAVPLGFYNDMQAEATPHTDNQTKRNEGIGHNMLVRSAGETTPQIR